ncbi:glutathione S-transferase family protein [Hoeflea prorocentri]|uniref:Glutathione S-transferase C-terminal domain-containing protein n=1 Tax=Hoeflea prorocentri TaxID=1922333 RepID=A0A9X3UIX3_9HYPH|nr:glutathione S-transferase C-terminal domain-containing protein [Hoeflea prorocentri]MCY6381472.1 glutathione S-transferase C-terminal domain-containing protein [Hoeflea prorocentri]MDA5399272.1 glutathione S-transferase C-terminal domain-containing protein [Hoeflea prorocentri]
MGLMLNGTYLAEDPQPDSREDGEFRRAKSTIRNWITRDGSAGPTGEGGFTPQPGRYHLFLAWNCPWAHRALLARTFKELDDAVSVSFAAPRRTEDGWIFEAEGDYAEGLFGASALHEIYARVAPAYTGRVTVPVLWDRERNIAVSNESADIVRMFNEAFDTGLELFPQDQSENIERWNSLIYSTVNNGVYRAGFARTQKAYNAAVREVFETLDKIEDQLSQSRYLTGDAFTECDLRLFPTLARFDVAYHYAFKCNLKRLQDYPNLWAYARDIYQMPGVAQTVRFEIYKQGYFSPSPLRNPLGIVPAGPMIDWSGPHGRG